METFKTEKKPMLCLKCQKEMVLDKVEVNYLGYTYPVELMICTSCGQVYVSEEVRAKMASVENTLEEK